MAETTKGKFECASCGGTFDSERSDEDAMKESRDNFGEVPKEKLAIVCEDCYNDYMEWIKKDVFPETEKGTLQ